jgi:hypothetical protein
MSRIIAPLLLATLFGCGRAPIDRTPITLDELSRKLQCSERAES